MADLQPIDEAPRWPTVAALVILAVLATACAAGGFAAGGFAAGVAVQQCEVDYD